jgi:hypothetical protein
VIIARTDPRARPFKEASSGLPNPCLTCYVFRRILAWSVSFCSGIRLAIRERSTCEGLARLQVSTNKESEDSAKRAKARAPVSRSIAARREAFALSLALSVPPAPPSLRFHLSRLLFGSPY